jgi:hypothetical protein
VREILHPVGTLVKFRVGSNGELYAIVIKSEIGWRGHSDHDIFIPSTGGISYGWKGFELFEVKAP